MAYIDNQTLEDLEFDTIQSKLCKYAIGPTAEEKLKSLVPYSDHEKLKESLLTVNELLSIRLEGEPFPSLSFDELKKEIRTLPIQNSFLSQDGFVRIAKASDLGNKLVYFCNKREIDYPNLCRIIEQIEYTDELIKAINKVFDAAGNIKDEASLKLAEIRGELKKVKYKINRNFDKELKRLSSEQILGDTREAFVNERRVLTVLSSHKRRIEGNVVGSSKTGSFTYLEPQINLQLNQEYEQLQDDEQKEIIIILKALTREIAGHYDLIVAYQEVLTTLDYYYAKMRLAVALNCSLPNINEDTHLELIDAFHPILAATNAELGKKTFPQHIKMDKTSRMLVISGPNAGGKSITLKTIGLLQLMLQSGLLVPVNPNSKMFLFQKIYSDIGDNQSIANELSTYSYRLKRMKYFLENTNRRTLLLLDEFGTGSDPELGGALAEVFFEELYNKKAFGVITTHYANIKIKADRLKNAVNGCMLFDTKTLAPLFKFSTGQPGSSFTFEVAQINGIPIEIIKEAKSRVDDNKLNMDKLLSDLQHEKNYLQKLNIEHIEAQELATKARVEYLEKKEQFEAKHKAQVASSERNVKYLNAGKKLLSFIDKFNTKSRKKNINEPLINEVIKYIKVEKSKTEALIEKAKTAPSKKKKVLTQKQVDNHQVHKIVVGSKVKLIATKQSGTVETIEGEQITVLFGFMRMKVALNKLTWVS
ncbi:MAG: DNA mismatch repair protein MutS2 [Lentimonas sp.]|jgi:DNA mismatch repair protein MutS2